ncbi:MAG: InlB B-repeat-containing protein [Alistipes sp.]|jgi:phosphate transport system substrate-binding protein|nr:InlB B-repeat-containing protein [Alistipes sp.]
MKRLSHILTLAALAMAVALAACEQTTYYTVTLDAGIGRVWGETEWVTVKKIAVAEGEAMPVHNASAPDGYGFDGWYRDAATTVKWDMYADVVTGDITLHAGYAPLYTVTYHANGGIFADRWDKRETATMDFAEGSAVDVPQNVMKPGHLIEGWYRDAELTDRWDFSTDVIAGDMELHAKWGAGIEGLTLENYPRVDGATSTRALNHMIACKLLGMEYTWHGILESPEQSVYRVDENGYLDDTFFDGRILTSQTYGAMMNLIEGKVEIILRSTTASPDERAAAEAAGVTLIETPIALDAFVFLKNRANPVASLTLDDVRKIYFGQITDWSQVGGRRGTITPYSRPRNSGSEEAFIELVMKDADPVKFPEEQRVRPSNYDDPFSMSRLMWEMEQNPNGIGYIFKNYKEKIMNRYEPVFSIDGVSPTAATMKNGTYPLTTKVYAIIRSDLDRSSTAYKLYEWLGTDAAKLVLEECGFVTL